MAARDDRSLAELIASLAREIPELLGNQIGLARLEASRALGLLAGALGRLAAGSVVAIGAIGLALAALVNGLAAWLVSRGMDAPIAATTATAVVTLVAAGIAGLLFWSALRSLRAAKASLDEGVASFADTAANVMEKF